MPPTLVGELNRALHETMESDERVHILGEDILDPYGGAFKVTRGLSDKFGIGRVHTTPISEQAIIGVASGMALRGLRPVVEIMFGDFLTLGMDQITNHISKWRYMYNDQVSVPLVIRTPMGGRRGYGPTHSQSIEARFMGLPAIKVVAPTRFGSPADLLKTAIKDDDPVLCIEYKTDYPRRLVTGATKDCAFDIIIGNGPYPTIHLSPQSGTASGLFICYGGMSEICLDAAKSLRESYDILTEILIFTCLHPLDVSPAVERIRTHGRCVVCEEGIKCFGWGSEVAARITEEAFDFLEVPVGRLGSNMCPIGTSKTLEEKSLPSSADLVQVAMETWQ